VYRNYLEAERAHGKIYMTKACANCRCKSLAHRTFGNLANPCGEWHGKYEIVYWNGEDLVTRYVEHHVQGWWDQQEISARYMRLMPKTKKTASEWRPDYEKVWDEPRSRPAPASAPAPKRTGCEEPRAPKPERGFWSEFREHTRATFNPKTAGEALETSSRALGCATDWVSERSLPKRN